MRNLQPKCAQGLLASCGIIHTCATFRFRFSRKFGRSSFSAGLAQIFRQRKFAFARVTLLKFAQSLCLISKASRAMTNRSGFRINRLNNGCDSPQPSQCRRSFRIGFLWARQVSAFRTVSTVNSIQLRHTTAISNAQPGHLRLSISLRYFRVGGRCVMCALTFSRLDRASAL